MATFCYDIDPHVVKVIRTSLDNGTDMSINVRAKGDARVFWASDWDIEQKTADARFEVQFGYSEYTIQEMKQNVAIVNQTDKPPHVLIELHEIEYVRSFPVTATSGLL